MIDQLKYFNGELADIEDIPDHLKQKHQTVFEVGYQAIIDAAARRQKWIDQSQSVNLFLATPDMKSLSHMYRHAWHTGLKTTYYLRSLAATGTEKSTVDTGNLNAVSSAAETPQPAPVPQACSLDDPDCEACQ